MLPHGHTSATRRGTCCLRAAPLREQLGQGRRPVQRKHDALARLRAPQHFVQVRVQAHVEAVYGPHCARTQHASGRVVHHMHRDGQRLRLA